jgi:mTERF domain-containing protein, mitochondrial
MFQHALVVAYSIRRDTTNIKMELMRSLGLSSSQVAVVMAKMPSILCASEDRLQRGMDFFTKEVGMDMMAITWSSVMLKFSIEGRIMPKLKVLKILKEKGLRGGNWAFYSAACLNDAQFIKRFMSPYRKTIPGLTVVLLGKAPARAATSWEVVWLQIA